MNLSLDFGPAGGITAQSIGAEAPDCGPKAQPQLDANGYWQCVGSQQGGPGSLGLFLIAAAALAWILWPKLGGLAKKAERVSHGHVEDLL